ncbi:MAG TPA: NAD-dependent epimerase/dehydratase family protein [Polyangiaceae bacterium]|nr:NAD-dependent epimerase/dehydratase family protein [Polyangiaceae bacterium]
MTVAYVPAMPKPPSRTTKSGAPSPEDWQFCDAMLPKVSRTFALSIMALPSSMRAAVRLAYLLCRAVDTIEDDAVVKGAARERLYDEFDRLMANDERDPSDFESMCAEVELGKGTDDQILCEGAGSIFRCFRSLDPKQRAAIRPHVEEMSRGMREFTRRADAVGKLRLRDLEELERYCYFVAGTVGKLLTALFELEVPGLPSHILTPLRARAVSFGLGLQIVNIVKDVAEDHMRGDCFLPEQLAEGEGITLDTILLPENREAGLRVVRAVCARAREHLQSAEEYTLLWPAEEAESVRLFCVVPLVLALATLREVEEGDTTLRPGQKPKISRDAVMQIWADAQHAVKRNDNLRWMIGFYAGGAYLGSERYPEPARERLSSLPPPTDGRRERIIATASDGDGGAPTRIGGGGSSKRETDDDIAKVRQFGGKVLVTGAAGHLGANVVHRLLDEGRDVRVLLRQGSNNEAMDHLDVERMYGDLRDTPSVRDAVRGVETIFHCAAKVSTLQGNRAHKREIFECNVVGTRNLLREAGDANVERIVVTGSFGATGYDIDDPTQAAVEDMPFYPFNTHLPYARSKHHQEHEVLKAVVNGQDVVICTSTAILGPHDYKPSRMGRTMMDYTHGKLRAYIPGGFPFVAASDLVDGHIRALERGRSGQKYTIATAYLTLDDIMDLWEDVTGVPRPKMKLPPRVMHGLANVSSFVLTNFFPKVPQRFTPDAVRILRMHRRADISKAREELGYQPSDIRDAIVAAYDDFARRGLVPKRPRRADDPPASVQRSNAATSRRVSAA